MTSWTRWKNEIWAGHGQLSALFVGCWLRFLDNQDWAFLLGQSVHSQPGLGASGIPASSALRAQAALHFKLPWGLQCVAKSHNHFVPVLVEK